MTDSQDELSRDDRQRAASLFKAYDVRGIVPEELTPALAREIGRALVATLRPDTVVVGRDMRVSSPVLAAALDRRHPGWRRGCGRRRHGLD